MTCAITGERLLSADLLYPLLIFLVEAITVIAVILIACFVSKPSTAALIVGIGLAVIKLLARLIGDIGYGAPSDTAELLVMAVAYLSDVLIVVIFYFVSQMTFKYLKRGELK